MEKKVASKHKKQQFLLFFWKKTSVIFAVFFGGVGHESGIFKANLRLLENKAGRDGLGSYFLRKKTVWVP